LDPFRELMYPSISLDDFRALRAKSPKRICFGSSHKNALKKNNNGEWAGSVFVPFSETIGVVFPWTLFVNTSKFGGYRRGIKTSEEFEEIQLWIEARSDLVFIRSLFNTAVASCEHYIGNSRSPIGSLEHSAKYEGNAAAKAQLVEILHSVFERFHRDLGITALLSVPSSITGTTSLPNELAARLSHAIGLPDLSASVSWSGPKGKIKELGVDEKWDALEKVGLSIGNEIKGNNILLIDDMYQSGATAHFLASRLRAAGANDLHLLAVSKGKRDTDNT
jgi:predicted amidophosphoribosyltransferase